MTREKVTYSLDQFSIDYLGRRLATPLQEAALVGDNEKIEELLLNIEDNDFQTILGYSPLHLASWMGHDGTMQLLIDHGADLNMIDHKGYYAIHHTTLGRHINATSLLLDLGEDINKPVLNELSTPLHMAVFNGDEIFTQFLIENGANCSALNSQLQAPLHIATLRNYLYVSKLLLNQNVEVDGKDMGGETPLFIAAKWGYDLVLKQLHQYGANINEKLDTGWTALHIAAQEGRTSSLNYLLNNGANFKAQFDGTLITPLHLAAYMGHTECVKSLVDKGANINAEALKNLSPLHAALQSPYNETSLTLISLGADVNQKTAGGFTPLHLVIMDQPEVVKSLVEHGANFTEKNPNGDSILHLALKSSKEDAALYLIDRGADVNEINSGGYTPLHLAFWNQPNVLEALVSHGALIDAKNSMGETLLYLGVKMGHLDITKFTVEHGANITEKCIFDANSLTPMNIAILLQKEEIIKYLFPKLADHFNTSLGTLFYDLSSCKSENKGTDLECKYKASHVAHVLSTNTSEVNIYFPVELENKPNKDRVCFSENAPSEKGFFAGLSYLYHNHHSFEDTVYFVLNTLPLIPFQGFPENTLCFSQDSLVDYGIF